jgi:hypothetical protein
MLNVEFRKVKGHNNDQWNDAADALAVRGRDGVMNWPKCSFGIIVQTGRITFPERAIWENTTFADVCTQLAGETHIKSQEINK